MIEIFILFAYAGAAMLSLKLIDNVYITHTYERKLSQFRQQDYYPWADKISPEEFELRKRMLALEEAESEEAESDNFLFNLVVFLFWPAAMTILVIHYCLKKLSKFRGHTKLMSSKAEREIARMQKTIEAKKTEKARMDKLIADAKAVNMDDEIINLLIKSRED